MTVPDTHSIGAVLSTLGQKKRLEILHTLLNSETGMGVTSLARELSVSAPTVEKHLCTLKSLGLVKKQAVFELSRERWVVRGHKRVAALLELIESNVRDLVEVGRLFEELERVVRKLQYYREHPLTVQEKEELKKEERRLDLLLEKLGKELIALLDEDEKKKVSYWSMARNTGLL
ncbi:MAG: ArsR family transcriptional regulator [Thermoproteota archaeon]